MCVTQNNPIRDTAEAVIKQLVSDQEVFTAYDVTEEVRSKMPGTTVYHFKLRDFIHSEMQTYVDDGTYDKEQDFQKHPNGPFVFTPVHDGNYGKKPHTSTQANRKFWNVRDSRGKWIKISN